MGIISKFPVLTALIGLVLVSSLFLMSVANADWVMFHGDERNTGVGTGDIRGPPRLLWNYTSQRIDGCGYSPIIANGILYEFSGANGVNLHALNVQQERKSGIIPSLIHVAGLPQL